MKPTISSTPNNQAQRRFRLIQDVFLEIGEEHRRLILMHARGYKLPDIAVALNLPEAQAQQQFSMAQQQFRHLIQQYYA